MARVRVLKAPLHGPKSLSCCFSHIPYPPVSVTLTQFPVCPPQPPKIKERTVEGLLELIERERCGEAINRPLVKGLLRMLSSLGIYSDAFHEPFMKASFHPNARGRCCGLAGGPGSPAGPAATPMAGAHEGLQR